jgi:hypothetical protein
MKNLTFIALTFCFLFARLLAFGQTDTMELPSYQGIITSPHIDVVLIKGDREGVKLEYSGVERDKINVEVKDNKLCIYLTNARYLPKRNKYYVNGNSYNESIYKDAKVVVYVTYVNLSYIEQRGDRSLICGDTLRNNKLRIELYGRTHADFAGLQTEKLNVALYGENHLTINGGYADLQKYHAYGENKVNAESLSGEEINTTSFGESRFMLKASDKITISTFGESRIYFSGLAYIQKGIIIGNNTIVRTEK